jgi:nicotinamidase-related amidase
MKRALLVIDVQNEYFTGKMPVSYPPGSLDHILQAMDSAHAHKVPVVVVRHAAKGDRGVFKEGTEGWNLHKNLPSSFTGTDLEKWLRENQIDTLTVSGYMTQMCCDSTAREGFHRGYKVEFLSDATGTLTVGNDSGKVADKDLHNSVLVTQASMFSKVMNTADWIKKLDEK